MATIGKVSAVFTASTSGLTTGVNQASNSFRSLGSAARQMDSGIAGAASSLRLLVGINAAQLFGSLASTATNAVRSLVAFGQSQAEVVDQTSKLAARLGMTYGELAGIAAAGELAGVSMDQIGAAATKADVAFVRASQGSAEAAAAFANIGLSLNDLAGMNAADRFDAIAQSIAALPTEAQRAAAAVQIFGRSGAELLPLFNGGAEAIRQAREEADRFGLSLTNAQGQNVEAMNDSFTRAGQAIKGIVQQVVAYLSPAITTVVEQFSNFIASVGGANIGQSIGAGILVGAEYLAGVADAIVANFGGVFEYLSQVGQQWSSVNAFLARTASFFGGVFSSFQVICGLAIRGFSGVFERLAVIAQNIGKYLLFDTTSIDTLVAGAQAFNAEIDAGLNANVENALANFDTALFGTAAPAGQAIARPFTDAIRTAREAAQQAAAAADKTKAAPVEIQQSVEIKGVTEALKAVDSRSSAGIAEMFRIMRGDTGNVQEQQLSALEKIVENTSGLEEIPAVSLAGA